MKIKERNSKRPALAGTYLSTGILLVLALVAVVGCDKNPLQTEPLAQAQIQPESEDLALSAVSRGDLQSYDPRCREASGLITAAEGGRIRLGWGGRKNSFRVQPGAVEEDVFVEITTCVVKGNKRNRYSAIEFDFGPDGQQFSSPAQIVISGRSLNALRSPRHGGVVRLYFYDPETDEWLIEQEAKIIKGKVTFEIDHFSKFGISH